MQVAPLTIYRFRTEFKPDPKDPAKLVGFDVVDYGPVGSGDRSVVTERVSRLKVVDGSPGANPALALAKLRYDYIMPRYEAWKAGQTLSVEGTPLSAWTGISKEQVEQLAMSKVVTVEELASLTDAHIQRIRLPGIRNLIEGAKRFLASADTNRATADRARQDQEIAGLKDTNAELLAKLNELAAELSSLRAEKDTKKGKAA